MQISIKGKNIIASWQKTRNWYWNTNTNAGKFSGVASNTSGPAEYFRFEVIPKFVDVLHLRLIQNQVDIYPLDNNWYWNTNTNPGANLPQGPAEYKRLHDVTVYTMQPTPSHDVTPSAELSHRGIIRLSELGIMFHSGTLCTKLAEYGNFETNVCKCLCVESCTKLDWYWNTKLNNSQEA